MSGWVWIDPAVLLLLNGFEVQAVDAACVITMLSVASGEMTEDDFAAWIQLHSVPA